MVQIEQLTDSIKLGEAPHWDPQTQSLYYVDIIGMAIYKYTPTTKKLTKASVGLNLISFVIPVDGEKNQFIVSLGREIVRIFWNSETEDVRIIEKITEVETGMDYIDNRFNDGKCDPTGRLWAGTFNIIAEKPLVYPPKGSLYTINSNRKCHKHLTGLKLSNGMAFNSQLQAFYFIDSCKGTIDKYDLDLNSGQICNCRPVFTLSKHNINGIPDGMTIDVDGNLWIAIFNGSKIIQINPEKNETLLTTIEMPVSHITSVAFGGKNLDELFVTTAAYKLENEDLSAPENGALFRITGLDTHGLPPNNFKLKM